MDPVDDTPEIEIAAPRTPDDPQDAGDGGDSPYKSLLVPLVVVPALIVMVIVLVFALFGMLSGSESSPSDNLGRLLTGGVNERQQAAFGLVRQILEYQTARAEGRDPEWGIDATFLDDLRAAQAGITAPTTPGEVWVPFVLSSLTAQLGDANGVDELVGMTRLGDDLDPEFTFRMNAIFILGSIGRELPEASRERVAGALIGIVDGEDDGLALLAAGALQNVPSSRTDATLEGLLGSRRIDMRLQAALSLAELGNPAGNDVLLELIQVEPYLAERNDDPVRWADQSVSISRRKALAALRELGRTPSSEVLQALIDDDGDPNVRSAALELASRPGG